MRTILLILLLEAGQAAAASWDYLAKDELLCAEDKLTCIRGTLTFERNYRVLRLRGRVESAEGPGTFAIRLLGTTRRGDQPSAFITSRIRRYSTRP